MKKIDIFLLVCIILMIFFGSIYLFFDLMFSFGIMFASTDVRLLLLVIEYSLFAVLLGLLLLKVLVNKK